MQHKTSLTSLYILSLIGVYFSSAHNSEYPTAKHLYKHDLSDSFIIRWGFQAIADHVYDPVKAVNLYPTCPASEECLVDPKKVKRGDIVFVRSIDRFIKEVHPSIENPYIILTHGEASETNHAYQQEYLADTKIIAWFSIHPVKDAHEKYYPIPLGIQQPKEWWFTKKHEITTLLKKLRETTPKTTLVYLNIDPKTDGERKLVLEKFAHKPYCLQSKSRLSFKDYLQEMAQCKFVLSPRGLGPDCYRTWEALLVGSIPIVRRCVYEYSKNVKRKSRCYRSQLDELYAGLPVLQIDSWDEITEEFLNKKYAEITSKQYSIAPLYMEYWWAKILKVKEDFLSRTHKSS